MKRLLVFVLVLVALSLASKPTQATPRIAGPSINPISWVSTWASNFVTWVEIIMTPPDPPTRPKNPAGGNSSWSKIKVEFGNVGSGHGGPTPPPPPAPGH